MSEFSDTDARLGTMHGYRTEQEAQVERARKLQRGEIRLNPDTLARIEAKLDALSTAVLEMAKAMIARGSL